MWHIAPRQSVNYTRCKFYFRKSYIKAASIQSRDHSRLGDSYYMKAEKIDVSSGEGKLLCELK